MSSIKGEEFDVNWECAGLGCVLFCAMKRNGNAVAQVETSTGLRDTYSALLERCISAALELTKRGVRRGDLIVVCTANHLNSCVPFVAAQFMGARVAYLDPLLTVHVTSHLLGQVKPRLLFVGVESIALIEKALESCVADNKECPEIVVFGRSPPDKSYGEFEEFVTRKSSEEEDAVEKFVPVKIEDVKREVAVIHFSSGTTGMPKGICLSHEALQYQAYSLTRLAGYDHTCCISYATGYWISTTSLVMSCILSRGCRVIVSKFDTTSFWRFLDKYKVTAVVMAPTQAMVICARGRPEGVSTERLQDVLVGGGPLSVTNFEKTRDLFPGAHVCLVYGLTETAGMSLNFRPKVRQDVLDMYRKPGSIGRVGPGFEFRVVDTESGEILGPNKRGELRIKTKMQTVGYYGVDSSGIWDEDGWLRTGDVGYYDEDECFYVVDRFNENLKYKRFHVPPTVIESALAQHPKVAIAVVVGLPDELDGDHPAAALVLKNGATCDDPQEFDDFVASKLGDRFRLRGGVKILDKLPTTATGKVRKSDVKKLFLLTKEELHRQGV